MLNVLPMPNGTSDSDVRRLGLARVIKISDLMELNLPTTTIPHYSNLLVSCTSATTLSTQVLIWRLEVQCHSSRQRQICHYCDLVPGQQNGSRWPIITTSSNPCHSMSTKFETGTTVVDELVPHDKNPYWYLRHLRFIPKVSPSYISSHQTGLLRSL
jgi:hypothetical protein